MRFGLPDRRTILNVLGFACAAIAVAVIGAWLLGRIVSDRFGWSQWLLWIPTPAALAAAGLGLLGASRPAREPRVRRLRLAGWALCGAALLAYFTAGEHRFYRRAADKGGGLLIVHGHAPVGRRASATYAERLGRLDADVTLLTGLLPPRQLTRLAARLGGSEGFVTSWPFALITPLPILEARHLVSSDEIRIVVFRIDTARALGGPLTIYAIDLPSHPTGPRIEVARTVQRLIRQTDAPDPDIVMGDFNMTRGSASLRAAFPGLAHAFDQGGRGYGASFHRDFPLFHIDHTLLAETVRAADYELVDPGASRHLVQVVQVVRADHGGK